MSSLDNASSSDDDQSWRLLQDVLPSSVTRQGQDLKGIVSYNEPNWRYNKEHSSLGFRNDIILEVISNGTIIDRMNLNNKSFYIFGSQDDCDIVYKNPQVSRRHFVLQFNRYHNLLLYDLNSKYKTTINNVIIASEKYYLLSVGDQIRIGKRGFSSRTYVITSSSSKINDILADIREVEGEKVMKNELKDDFYSVDDRMNPNSLSTTCVDEWDDYFDNYQVKRKKVEKADDISSIIRKLYKLQKDELNVLNGWYEILRRHGSTENDITSGAIDMMVENAKRNEFKHDHTKYQKSLDDVRKDLDHYFKILNVLEY